MNSPIVMRQFDEDEYRSRVRAMLDADLIDSMSDIFAGALVLYKNASSHRTGVVNDPHEAAELLVLASHLLKIVERRVTP